MAAGRGGSPHGVVAYLPHLTSQYCGPAVAYPAVPTLARMSHDADRSAGLHTDRNGLARGAGRSANAVPGTGAAAQRGDRGLERGDESTAIGALRSIISCLPGRRGDTQLR